MVQQQEREKIESYSTLLNHSKKNNIFLWFSFLIMFVSCGNQPNQDDYDQGYEDGFLQAKKIYSERMLEKSLQYGEITLEEYQELKSLPDSL